MLRPFATCRKVQFQGCLLSFRRHTLYLQSDLPSDVRRQLDGAPLCDLPHSGLPGVPAVLQAPEAQA